MATNKQEQGTPPLPPAKTDEFSQEERRTTVRPIAESRPPPSDAADGLNQLREILVGSTVRELERRLARAEAHMAAKAHDLEQESRRRIEVIEAHLRKESDALTARMEREVAQTSEAIRAVTREHRESLTAADQRAAKLDEALVRAQRELRDQLLQQAKKFLDELQHLRREVTETLERELGPAEAGFEGGHGNEERPSS